MNQMQKRIPDRYQRPAWNTDPGYSSHIRRWQMFLILVIVGLLGGMEIARTRANNARVVPVNPTVSPLLLPKAGRLPSAERDIYGGELPPEGGKDLADRMVQAMAIPSSLLIASTRQLTIKAAETLDVHQENTITYQREPPLFSSVSIDGVSGTRKLIADGLNIYDYQVSSGTYTRRRFAGSFVDLINNISLLKPEIFSPTTLLSGGNLTGNFSNLVILKKGRVGNEPCYILEATVAESRLKALQQEVVGHSSYRVVSGSFKIWIAVRDKLPRQWKSFIKFSQPIDQKVSVKKITIYQFEKVNRLIVGPVFQDSPFHFDPPHSSREVFRPVG